MTALRPLLQVSEAVRPVLFRAAVAEAVGATARMAVGILVVGALAEVLAGHGRSSSWWLVGLALGLAAVVLAWLGQWLSALWSHQADNSLQQVLRERLIDQIRMSPLSWVDRHGSVTVKRMVTEDVDALHHLVGHAYGRLVLAVVQATMGLVFLLWIAPLTTAIAALPAMIAVLVARHQRGQIPAQMARYQEASASVDRAGVEFAQGIAPLKIFGGTERGLVRFRAAADEYAAFVSSWARQVTPSMVAQQVLLSPAAVWAALGVLAVVTPMEPLALIAVAVILPLLLSPVESLAFAVQDLAGGLGAARRIEEVLAGDAVRKTPATGAPVGKPPTVRLEQVSVAHGEHIALDQVTVTLPAGGLTVLVGHSGAGKSTLLEVIAGLREPTSGHVAADNGSVGAVWQRPYLVQASILDNLRLARPDASEGDCRAASSVAGVDDRIQAMTDGYHTIVGEDVSLSGGEQQRLCLARTLLAHPDLLLLDEPTAAVDTRSARIIDEAVEALRGQQTIVRSDHRIEVALDADLVVVLAAGALIEAGAPDDLRARGGAFAQMLEGAQP